MRSSLRKLLVVAGAAMTACGPIQPGTDADWSSDVQPIIGGVTAAGDPAVVALAVRVTGGYEDYCTGTLIGPKTVLTAAHCIDAYDPGDPYYVLFGTTTSAPTSAIAVAAQVANPNYHGSTSDFGLLRLATPVTSVAPIPLNTTAMDSSWLGRSIRHVGFGVSNAQYQSGSGTKREVTYTLRSIRTMEIESGASGKQTCHGDSGGPAFMAPPSGGGELLVGVVSWGDPSCSREGWDGRVDAVQAWIRQTMGAWETPTCGYDGACVANCTPVDQDCVCAADGTCSADCLDSAHDPDCPRDCAQNGVCATQSCPRPDSDCVTTGGACASQLVCRSRLCVTDAQHPQTYCTTTCAASGECPTGMECAAGQCQFIPRPERQLAEYCDARVDFCVQSLCTGPQGGATRCVKACVTSSDCGANATCEGGRDGARYCRPAGLSFEPPQVLLPAFTELRQAAAGCTSAGALPMTLAAVALALARRRSRAHGGPR